LEFISNNEICAGGGMIMSTILSVILRLATVLVYLALIITLAYKFIKVFVEDTRKDKFKILLIKIVAVVIVIFSFNYMINARWGWYSPYVDKQYKKYVLNLKVEKSSGDTKIKIDDVLMDLNKLYFHLGVKGKDKLVAVEVKKNLQDDEPLREIIGLWLGKRFMYSYNDYGVSYKSETFIDPIYIVCYLSSGEEVSFKVEDTKDIKYLSEIIHIDKDFQEEGEKIRIRTFANGVTYGELYMVSDLPFSSINVSIFIDDKEYKDLTGYGGGGQEYRYTPPIGNSKAYIKIVVKSSGAEYKIDIQ
jgi:hypothetical protein